MPTDKRSDDRTYSVIQLNPSRTDGWAVIGLPSGAVALTAGGRLIMRLRKDAAEQMARRLSGTTAGAGRAA